MQKPVEKPIKFVKNAATFGKTYPVTHIEAVIDGNGKTLPDILELMLSTIPSTSGDVMSYTNSEGNTRYIASTDDPSGIVGGGGMTEVTWLELKDLRDNSQLLAGSLYRITDYNCTTTQENTRSAGHQFDIVLLALSEDKLAEEGWAMMHDTPIYDVTFSDRVTKKCYIGNLRTIDEGYAIKDYVDIVYVDTLLGYPMIPTEALIINEETKTASFVEEYPFPSTEESYDDVTYNYFQNSNLSAWKVWYCLDNDKSRFAWADDGEILSIKDLPDQEDSWFIRDKTRDNYGKYAWYSEDSNMVMLTDSSNPKVGDILYGETGKEYYGDTIASIKGFGRGVIYRLIDEWNNDVGYDFKNIQFVRKTTDAGVINPSTGVNTWVYTFSVCNDDTKEFSDYSITSKTFLDDVGDSSICYENKIKNAIIAGGTSYMLNNVVFHVLNIPNDTTRSMHHNTCEYTINVTIGYGNEGFENIIFTKATNIDYSTSLSSPIISDSKRAVFESFTPL